MATKLIIDVGMTSVRLLQLKSKRGTTAIVDALRVEYANPLTPESLTDTLAEALQAARTGGRFRGRSAVVALAPSLTWLRPVTLPPIAADHARLRALVDYEAEQSIPFPLSDVCWDYHLMVHQDQDAEVVFAVAKREIVACVLAAMRRARLRVQGLTSAPAALHTLAHASGLGANRCDLLIDFGSHSTILLILLGDRTFVRTIGIGGECITRAVAKRLGLSRDEAEELKLAHAHAADGDICTGADSLAAKAVAEETRRVLARLAGEIRRSLATWRTGAELTAPTRLHLSGGSSALPFLDEYLAFRLGIECQLLAPADMQGLQAPPLAPIAAHAAVAAGLALSLDTPDAMHFNLLPTSVQGERRAARALPYLAAAAVIWLSLLGGGLAWAKHQAAITKTALTSANGTAGKLTEAVAAATSFQEHSQLRARQQQRLATLVTRRQAMTRLWAAVERARPQTVQLTRLTPMTRTTTIAPSSGSLFPPQAKAVPRAAIVGLQLEGTISQTIGQHIFSADALSQLPDAPTQLPASADDDLNIATADPSRTANLLAAALKTLPEFNAGDVSFTSFAIEGDGRARFSLKVELRQPLPDWEDG